MPKRYAGNATELAQVDAYVKLMRAADTVQAILARNVESFGLTLSQFGVLEILHHQGAQNQKELAQKILRSGANMTTIIDNLEKKNIVCRTPDVNDRRSTRVSLTPEGKELIIKIFPFHMQNIYRMMGTLADDELANLSVLCKKLGTTAPTKMTL